MKKLFVKALFPAFILLGSCQQNNADKDKYASSGNGNEEKVKGKACMAKKCKSYADQRATGRINGYLALRLAGNYRNDMAKSYVWNGANRSQTEDARSIWFSLETLKQYIWDIEHAVCESNCPADTLGIRIYFARYPKSDDNIWSTGMEGLQRYADHHTVFMVPTYRNGKSNIDFDPKRGCRAPFDTTPTAKPTSILSLIDLQELQNHGSIIPPDGKTGTAF